MKLDREPLTGNVIRGCAGGQVQVGNAQYSRPVIIAIDRIIADWSPPAPAALTLADLQPALDLDPEVILLGTGAHQGFAPVAVVAAVLRRGIGLETMTTAAACRTYNVLASESRRVVAALILP
ncbi:MAG: hypothetical protein IT486_06695 [Gammaproteobacteria bacterium]|nr:hypothetical protein [Gammaproteobacteria bacterium]